LLARGGMAAYNHDFGKYAISLFFTAGLDSTNPVENACEISFSAHETLAA
jgi:hypothetical protein